jgi:hypothetical protein
VWPGDAVRGGIHKTADGWRVLRARRHLGGVYDRRESICLSLSPPFSNQVLDVLYCSSLSIGVSEPAALSRRAMQGDSLRRPVHQNVDLG